jgi:hypothetical protein
MLTDTNQEQSTQPVFCLQKALRPPGQGYQFSAEVKHPPLLATIAPGTLEAQEVIFSTL